MKLSLTFSMRLALLALMLFMGLLLAGGLGMVLAKASDNVVAVTRITMVAQSLLAFVLPAVALAILVTRRPAEFLMIKSFPRGQQLLLCLLGLVCFFPAVEWINSVCESLPWPDAVINAENKAAAQTVQLLGVHNGVNLAVSILIVGVMAGLSEELFFRGALQRVFATRPMSIHLAIWLSAIIFSLMHAQLVGFVPRMLLGAFFGYAAVWTSSVWTAVILHIVNNSAAVITMWAGVDMMSTPAVGICSIMLFAVCLRAVYSKSRSSGM